MMWLNVFFYIIIIFYWLVVKIFSMFFGWLMFKKKFECNNVFNWFDNCVFYLNDFGIFNIGVINIIFIYC